MIMGHSVVCLEIQENWISASSYLSRGSQRKHIKQAFFPCAALPGGSFCLHLFLNEANRAAFPEMQSVHALLSWRWLRYSTEVENKRHTHLDFIWGSQQTWTGFDSHKMVILKLFLLTLLHQRVSFYPPVQKVQTKCYQVSNLIRQRAADEAKSKRGVDKSTIHLF